MARAADDEHILPSPAGVCIVLQRRAEWVPSALGPAELLATAAMPKPMSVGRQGAPVDLAAPGMVRPPGDSVLLVGAATAASLVRRAAWWRLAIGAGRFDLDLVGPLTAPQLRPLDCRASSSIERCGRGRDVPAPPWLRRGSAEPCEACHASGLGIGNEG